MNEQVKKYLKVSFTLGIIAASAALLIGLANLITANRIVENNRQKELAALKEVYGENDTSIYHEVNDIDYSLYAYIETIYYDQNDSSRFIYKTSGKNAYGTVTMIVGVDKNGPSKLCLTENTETYKDTLEENYVNPYNSKKRDYSDVSCGATYGAKLIRDMINEAINDYNGRIK